MTQFYRTAIIWLKQGETPLARQLFSSLKAIRVWQLPRLPLLFNALYWLYGIVHRVLTSLVRILWWTPLFRSQVKGPAGQLLLYGGMPMITGGLKIWLGNRCRLSGHTTLSGRSSGSSAPELHIGDNVDLGWQTSVAVGSKVWLGDNVRIAGQCLLAGYPGHPMDAKRRAMGEPEDESQVGEIILEDDVWLATGVKVMAGVTIGKGTVVAAGSVVTHSLPAGVLAAGGPARVIRTLEAS